MNMDAATVKYPIGIQTFSDIIEGGYVYVDKTALVYELANNGKYIFLSRPRRFGKSLLLTTLQAYFEGRRELFDGLAVEHLEREWNRHAVLLLSLAAYNASKPQLEEMLDNRMREFEAEYGVVTETRVLSERFRNIIRAAYEKTGRQVVVLVDEYDAPMLAHLEEPGKHEAVRDLLKSIYVSLKDMDAYIRFAMLTGVSRFSRMTIFSGLNNLNDVSLDPEYAEICGITEQELTDNFHEGISRLAAALGTDRRGALDELKSRYDGYHFTCRLTDIYNPFSLIQALAKSDLGSYWFSSGTPTFLIRQIWRNPGILAETFNNKAGEQTLADIDTFGRTPIPLMFQTGYLTIKDFDMRRRVYTLGIPNREVEQGLFEELLAYEGDNPRRDVMPRVWDIRDLLDAGEIDEALKMVRSFLAGIPYTLSQGKPEIYFENNLYLLFKLLGIDTRAEWATSHGRIDMLLETARYIYVMELKLDGTADGALEQIDSKEYALQFEHDGRRIIRVGLNFSRETRNIDTWVVAV